tara:strand:- start:672 stop:977 length:306 start_codon:yes stop_codon:yes gene_type:complete
LKLAKQRMYEPGAGMKQFEKALIMGILFFPEKENAKLPKWVYVLIRPANEKIKVQVKDKKYSCVWKVVGMTTNYQEAEKFLGEPPHCLKTRTTERLKKWKK